MAINESLQNQGEQESAQGSENITEHSIFKTEMEENQKMPVQPQDVAEKTGETVVESTKETLETESIQQSGSESPETSTDDESKMTREELLRKLRCHNEVQLRDFIRVGNKFADMDKELQRGETKKGVAILKDSLKNTKTFFRPIEVMEAKKFIESGRQAYKVDGTELLLSDPDIDLYWVRLDGKQRSIAYAKLFLDKDFVGKESDFDVRVKLANVAAEEIDKYVREIQVATNWDEATKRQAAVAKLGSTESGLTLINKFVEESKMSARAAYKLIYRKEGYKKELYEKSMRDGAVAVGLQATPELIKRAENDYQIFKIAFRNHQEYLRNSAAIDALITVFTSAVDGNAAANDFLNFLQQLQETDFSSLASKKEVSEKQNEFLRLHEVYKSNYESDSSFKDTVLERISAALKEYEDLKETAAMTKKIESKKKSTEEKYYQA